MYRPGLLLIASYLLLIGPAYTFSSAFAGNRIRHFHKVHSFRRHKSNQILTPACALFSETIKSSSIPQVLEAIDQLFPPQKLDERIALSRKDGYWPFISSGDEPPQEFVYGEFNTAFFAQILQRAGEILAADNDSSFQNWVFCDLGSGTGRLVLTAAGLFPWRLCRGVELLEGIHNQAVEKLESCRDMSISVDSTETFPDKPLVDSSSPSDSQSAYWKQYQEFTTNSNDDRLTDISLHSGDERNQDLELATSSDFNDLAGNMESTKGTGEWPWVKSHLIHNGHNLPLSPVQLSCGSFTDPYQFFGDSHIVFVYSSAMPYHILMDLARAVGRQCQTGTLVITTEYQLPTGGHIPPSEEDQTLPHGEYEIELVETLTGENESTGGQSTVFIQRLTKSLGDGIPRNPPELPVSEIAYRVIKQMERGELNNPKLFLRNVSNQMAFLGLPESWWPKLSDSSEN